MDEDKTLRELMQELLDIQRRTLEILQQQQDARSEQVDRLTRLLNISTQGLQFQQGMAGLASRGH